MRSIVEAGYDAIAERYLSWSLECDWPGRRRYLSYVLDALTRQSDVLELGCGAGLPATRALAEQHRVVGVNISKAQLELARRNAPQATFVKADMAALDLPDASFDAICAFYSITHVRREGHSALLAKIASWLRPGGLFVSSFGFTDNPAEVEDDWLGAPMFFSHFDAETSTGLVAQAGLEVLVNELEPQREHGVDGFFLWIVARRP